ncbi:tail fiber domain-containing protein [Bacteroidota bacterium]
MKKMYFHVVAAVLLLFSMQTLFAQVLPFQGRLLMDGEPVTDQVSLVFSIEKIQWSETHQAVSVMDGLYSVELGSIDTLPKNLFYGMDHQILKIQVNGTELTPVKIYPAYTDNMFHAEASMDSTGSSGLVSMVTGVATSDAWNVGGEFAANVESGANLGVYAEASGGNNNIGLWAQSENGYSIYNATDLTNPDLYTSGQLTSLHGVSNVGGRAMQAQYTAEGPGHGVGLSGYSGGGGINWGVWGRAHSFSDSMQVAGNFQAFGEGFGHHFGVMGEATGWNSPFNVGVYGTAHSSPGENWAGWFEGDMKVTGNLSVDGSFMANSSSQRYALEHDVSDWQTMDFGTGIIGAQLNFNGGWDGERHLTGGGSFGTKSWDTENPWNGYLHINDSVGQAARLEAVYRAESDEHYGELSMRTTLGRHVTLNSWGMWFNETANDTWKNYITLGLRDDLQGSDPEGKTGHLYLHGTNTPNIELTGKSWENNDLPLVQLFGSQESDNGWYHGKVLLQVETDSAGMQEWGTLTIAGDSANHGIYMDGLNGTIDAKGWINGSQFWGHKENGRYLNAGTQLTDPDFYDAGGLTYMSGFSNVGGRAFQAQYNADGPGHGIGIAGYSGGEGMNWGVWGRTNSRSDSTQFAGKFEAYGNGFGEHYGVYTEATAVNSSKNIGIYASAYNGLTENWAAWFEGNSMMMGDVTVSGTITANTVVETSDRRLKNNIEPLENSLTKMLAIQGVSFEWKDKTKPEGQHIGLIAQDVEEVYPELVHTMENGTKAVNYSQMVAVLIESVRELNTKVEMLEEQNAQLKDNLLMQDELKAEMEVLKTMLLNLANEENESIDAKNGNVSLGQSLNK